MWKVPLVAVAVFTAINLMTQGHVTNASEQWSVAEPGPYKQRQYRYRARLPGPPSVAVDVILTAPKLNSMDCGGQLPTVVFFPGFTCHSCFYTEYAERLASWGYAVLQYNKHGHHIFDDVAELPLLDQLLEWVDSMQSTLQRDTACTLRTHAVAVSGHSRGAKLAALHLARNEKVVTAYLIDPVDRQPDQSPQRYPAAVDELRQTNKPFAVVGAQVSNKCNPAPTNHNTFFAAAQHGAWHTVVLGNSHHMQFAEPARRLPLSCTLWKAWRAAIGAMDDSMGPRPRFSEERVISLTLVGLSTWLRIHHPTPTDIAAAPTAVAEQNGVQAAIENIPAHAGAAAVQYTASGQTYGLPSHAQNTAAMPQGLAQVASVTEEQRRAGVVPVSKQAHVDAALASGGVNGSALQPAAVSHAQTLDQGAEHAVTQLPQHAIAIEHEFMAWCQQHSSAGDVTFAVKQASQPVVVAAPPVDSIVSQVA